MFKKILIANRGEIALRVIRCCRELGIRAAVVYSKPDARAAFVRESDDAVPLDGSSAGDTYLKAATLIEAAKRVGAEAIHPGYGFLAENASFASTCEEAGLAFIGPRSETLLKTGDKIQARNIARSLGIPVIPGFDGAGESKVALAAAAQHLGFPVLLKAQSGGGGRGIRQVDRQEDFEPALLSASTEASGAFNNARLYVEKLIHPARHVEIQILGDAAGHVLHLFERECSVQRRRQKLIEETPAPGIPSALVTKIAEAAVRFARAVNYRGVGTVEFLVTPPGRFYFIEMNSRLQVEHPVTECATGLDLVHSQIRVCAGEPLDFGQSDVNRLAHAIECRVYAEDPCRDFLPSTGQVQHLRLPEGPHVRCDSGIQAGDEITPFYDSLLLKVITWGTKREIALAKMRQALQKTVILGVRHNTDFLRAAIDHPAFVQGDLSTAFIDQHLSDWRPATELSESEWLALAAFEALGSESSASQGRAVVQSRDPWETVGSWRNVR